MKGDFQVLINGKVQKFSNFDEIPKKSVQLSNVVGLLNPLHSEEGYKLISTFNDKLHELMRREWLTVTRIGDADVTHCSGMVRAEGS